MYFIFHRNVHCTRIQFVQMGIIPSSALLFTTLIHLSFIVTKWKNNIFWHLAVAAGSPRIILSLWVVYHIWCIGWCAMLIPFPPPRFQRSCKKWCRHFENWILKNALEMSLLACWFYDNIFHISLFPPPPHDQRTFFNDVAYQIWCLARLWTNSREDILSRLNDMAAFIRLKVS